jgi:DNA repair exonuclease SbcCD nuclease subunit
MAASVQLPVVRFLHTSDIHIDNTRDPAWALRAVVDTAIDCNIDIVLIAGDLFDHARISEETAAATLNQLARLDQPVVVIPGNHDCIDEGSVYHRVNLSAAGRHVHFVRDPDGEELLYDALRLHIWARGIENHHPAYRPLSGYRPGEPTYWSVVLTHGHYVPEGESSHRSSQIHQQEIAQLSCHYLALGHWHRFLEVTQGDVKAFYCGSPSESGAGAGSVNLVTLDPERGVQVDRQTVTGTP